MEFITKYKDLAEFVYFLTGPLMLIGVVIGIFQLIYLKKDIVTRVSRESISLSISILDDKFKEFNTLLDKTFDDKIFKDIPFFKGKVKGFIRSSIECENDFIEKIENEDNSDHFQSVYKCLDCLETLAQYINFGICDEEKCYKLEGNIFMSSVENLKEYIAYCRHDEKDVTYENIISLYELWIKRLEHEKILKNSDEIKSKLKENPRPKPLKVVGK